MKFTGEIKMYYPGRDPSHPHVIETGDAETVQAVALHMIDGGDTVLMTQLESGIVIQNDTRELPPGTIIEFPIGE